eukprot:scaffold12280_cov32-Tisochrysis_lutea.AAC.1
MLSGGCAGYHLRLMSALGGGGDNYRHNIFYTKGTSFTPTCGTRWTTNTIIKAIVRGYFAARRWSRVVATASRDRLLASATAAERPRVQPDDLLRRVLRLQPWWPEPWPRLQPPLAARLKRFEVWRQVVGVWSRLLVAAASARCPPVCRIMSP